MSTNAVLRMAAVTRVIVAYDHPVVMVGIKVLMSELATGLEVVGHAANGVELLALLSHQPCDLLILDFSMPCEQGRPDGLMLLISLRQQYRDIPIIVLTMVHRPAAVRGLLAAGANAVVGKVAMVTELILATSAVQRGCIYVSEDLREDATDGKPRQFLEGRFVPSNSNLPAALSKREAEIVRLYAEGYSITQISGQVHRSVKTISQQKNDAMRKLGLTTNSQLYEYARLARLA